MNNDSVFNTTLVETLKEEENICEQLPQEKTSCETERSQEMKETTASTSVPKRNMRLKAKSLPTSPSSSRRKMPINQEIWSELVDELPQSSVILDRGYFNKQFFTQCRQNLKLIFLLSLWFIITFILMTKGEQNRQNIHQLSIPKEKTKSFWIFEPADMDRINVEIGGSLLPKYYGNMSKYWTSIWIEVVLINSSSISEKHILFNEKITKVWSVPTVSENLIDFVPEVKRNHNFDLNNLNQSIAKESVLRIVLETNLNRAFPLSLSYQLSPIDPKDGIIYAAAVLIGLYILIIFEIVHRTLAATMACAAAIAILAIFDARPPISEMVTWLDMETLLLLFSMMILVTIFSETGVFDYLAVFACKITNGRVWPLINTLCVFTALISSFLDNVTTALFMTPVTIRLCEVIEVDPVPILMAVIMFSNIGGALTPVGDPPNVIIASNKDIKEAGVTFGVFALHMGTGLAFVMIYVHFHLRYTLGDLRSVKKYPSGVRELKHEIEIWQRTAASLSSYTKDEFLVKETLSKKVRRLLGDLKRKLQYTSTPVISYEHKLKELNEKYPIRDLKLLIKSAVTLAFVLILFFLHSVPELNLSLGLSAFLGVLLLLLLADIQDVESLLARVEWSTLIFFASLFILMEALSRLGLIDCIGQFTEDVILSVKEENRLTVAIILILWVSALASSCVDNIPLTTMMVRIVTSLSVNQELKLPLQPLVWSLALGACLGGNGTLIGASANVVCAGVAEQHGYRISFIDFLKIGFPTMLGSVTITMIYLLVAHVALAWNS